MSAEERIRRVLSELGVNNVKVFVHKFFPGIATIPFLKAVVASEDVVEGLSDDDLKAVLAHEAYHLSMTEDRRRLVRNFLLSSAAYLILVDIFLIACIPYVLLFQNIMSVFPSPIFEVLAIGVSVPYLMCTIAVSTRLSRRVLTRLMKYVPFGIEEEEANQYAESIVGAVPYRKALWFYTVALKQSMRRNALLRALWKNTLMVSEAINPHPAPHEKKFLVGDERGVANPTGQDRQRNNSA